MVGRAGFLVAAVQESICVEVVKVAPAVGAVMLGVPVGVKKVTVKDTVANGPQFASANPAAVQARTAKIRGPEGRLMSALVEEPPPSDPLKVTRPVVPSNTRRSYPPAPLTAVQENVTPATPTVAPEAGEVIDGAPSPAPPELSTFTTALA